MKHTTKKMIPALAQNVQFWNATKPENKNVEKTKAKINSCQRVDRDLVVWQFVTADGRNVVKKSNISTPKGSEYLEKELKKLMFWNANVNDFDFSLLNGMEVEISMEVDGGFTKTYITKRISPIVANPKKFTDIEKFIDQQENNPKPSVVESNLFKEEVQIDVETPAMEDEREPPNWAAMKRLYEEIAEKHMALKIHLDLAKSYVDWLQQKSNVN